MPQSLSKVYIHIIFSTKNRTPWISEDIRPNIQGYIVETASKLGVYTEEIYINPDHLHILCTLPRTLTIADLIQKIKISSSNKISEIGPKEFYWQKGYGVFSVSQSKTGIVKEYIQNQKEHHKKITFEEEYRKFLQEYKIEYDEKYVWD